MGQLATSNKQLIYIYSEDSKLGNRLLTHVRSMQLPVRIINLNKESIADTIWCEIASMLNTSLGHLFSGKIEGKESSELSVCDWLKMINNNPSLLEQPIAINGTDAKQLKEKYDIFPFFELTGSNFDKTPRAIQTAEHKDTTHFKNAM